MYCCWMPLAPDFLEARFWTARRRAEVLPDYFRLADQPGTAPFVDPSAFVGPNLENAVNFCIARDSGNDPSM